MDPYRTSSSEYGRGVVATPSTSSSVMATPRKDASTSSRAMATPRKEASTSSRAMPTPRKDAGPAQIDNRGSDRGAPVNSGTIPWTDAEYKYQGTYTGGLKDGKPHGKGDFVQQGGNKHLIGEWDNGVKQGPFVRRYLNGFRWVGTYVNDLREGEWRYIYAGADPLVNVYYYSKGRRVSGRSACHFDLYVPILL